MRYFLTLVVLATVVFFVNDAMAVNQNNTGCGWGTQWMADKEGVLWEISATSTNASTYSQAFGISSGTAGCERPGSSQATNDRLENFVNDNMDMLARDMARGNGEYLSTLATLMEVNDTQRPQFYRTLQSNFSRIFTSGNISNTEVISNIHNVLNAG